MKRHREAFMKKPCIYYFCPDFKGVVGGVKTMYRHVDILNRNGFDAAILHSRTGFRCGWFDNETKIAYVRRTRFDKEDVIVFPEPFLAYFTDAHNPVKPILLFDRIFSKSPHKYYLNELSKAPVRKVIFNQSGYLTFEGMDYAGIYDIPYLRKDVVATICVSDDSKEYLNFAFPGARIYRVRLSANEADFYYGADKKPQIAFIANRSLEDANQVLNILKARNSLEGFRLISIKGISEKQVAQILRESLVFLSFGRAEGFSLPPMEAMLCGCIVVGYNGRAGREYFDPAFCYPVEIGDIIGFARSVEAALAAYRENPGALAQKAKTASEHISLRYNARIEETDLKTIWAGILESNPV
ncbi:MAG: glycosyltransferase [Acidobacteriota bacterium]|nr:glycosyltransferase [Acidobacteriota bacterium]